MEMRKEMEMLKKEFSVTRENDLSSYVRRAAAREAAKEIPYVALCAYKQVWEPETIEDTAITYDKFLSNFNNADKPGGGDGQLDLDTGKKLNSATQKCLLLPF